jgi:hypothetical protein
MFCGAQIFRPTATLLNLAQVPFFLEIVVREKATVVVDFEPVVVS